MMNRLKMQRMHNFDDAIRQLEALQEEVGRGGRIRFFEDKCTHSDKSNSMQ